MGGDPFYFGYTSDDFHAHNISRNKNWPLSMITTSTHDTKRSEDVRMRINVLSEIPDEWENNIRQWAEKNKNLKILVNNVYEPKPNTEYFIYQTLIGVWPDNPVSTESMGSFIERIWQYILKSIREAKIYTNWIKPETNYEKAIKMFMNAILTEGESNGFLESFKAFQNKISFLGKLNTLSATVIKIGSPGVVDIYQGNETWNYCLVDPDNRGLVDFKLRKSLFNKLNKNSDPNVFTGDNIENLKFYYTMQGLLFRRRNKDLFIGGEYIPVEVKGPGENNIIAFIRRHGDDIALIVALRLFANLITEKDFKMKSSIWKNTELILSKEISNISNLQNIFNNNVIPVESKNENLIIKTSDLFINTCVCILTNITKKNL
ncbi:MAG: hypothetical protein ACD_79C00349G0001 [uncultured bacterium]|nr:MAG: hypothetical protein ACD_79C00349G0001 [uncultured bacterium]